MFSFGETSIRNGDSAFGGWKRRWGHIVVLPQLVYIYKTFIDWSDWLLANK